MSRKLFEYFFTPAELEPYYSELTGTKRRAKLRSQPAKKSLNRKVVAKEPQTRSNEVQSVDSSQTHENRSSQTADEDVKSGTVNPPDGEQTSNQRAPESPRQVAPEASNGAESANTKRHPEGEEQEHRGNEVSRTRTRNLLSVHALGQYVFCPRAAILAAERGDQRDLDEPLPRPTFLPNFDLDRIEGVLAQKFKHLVLALVLLVALPTSMVLSLRNETMGYFYLAAATLFFALMWTADLLTAVVKLAIRRAAALRAEAREPEPAFSGTEPVNWWSMLNAGFEPITHQRQFQHPELPLEGNPWRVLHKGSLRIPVIQAGGDRLGNQKDRLFPKHEVRLTAYAMLLEADGHHKGPYGLVFPADSPRGLAFSITDNHRRQAVQLLAEFEKQLDDSQQRNVHPGLPANRNCCTNCDYGKPIATSIREVNSLRKAGEQVVILQSRSDQLFHCDCADRFGSAPPHRDAIRMGLRAILE